MSIHPTAVIAQGAEIAASAQIGAYCVIGAHVRIGDGVKLHSHVAIDGDTEIGEGTEVFPFASLGHAPQDLKFKGEKTRLVIGKRNRIREHVTMNPGTQGGGGLTQVGDDCLFMTASHVAHDCKVGNHVILANNATLAGHVQVGDGAIIGGLAAIHQFVRIGQYAIVGGMSGVERDVIPYGSVLGERAHLAGLNLVGLKRRDVSREAIHALRNAYKTLFEDSTDTLGKRLAQVKDQFQQAEVKEIIAFLESDTDRSFTTPRAA